MKKFLIALVVVGSVVAVGCENNTVQPDPTDVKKAPLPPGTKTKDVLLPINKN